jgi:Mlc titration factor MtfA (ptsG expression regulator)
MLGPRFFIFISEVLRQVWILAFHYRLSQEDKETLEKYFPYYSNLKPAHQKEFRHKLQLILTQKRFFARGGLDRVSAEMKVLIGATIVQVTFGYRNVWLKHFNKILIYPNTYFSNISKTYHRGEVNPRHGIIVLSWECFVRGLALDHDGVNLGIHEIAHALKLENQIQYNGESNFFNPKLWQKYSELAAQEKELLKQGEDDFFRERGAVDLHEFFAVALENFFERPDEFKRRKLEMYQVLVMLLQQDPLTLRAV